MLGLGPQFPQAWGSPEWEVSAECPPPHHHLPPNSPKIAKARLPSPGEGPAWTKPRGTWIQMTRPPWDLLPHPQCSMVSGFVYP